MRGGASIGAAAMLAAASLLAGCGSRSGFPPAAEPPDSPPQAAAPAGRVIELGHGPEGIVADARTGLVAVCLRDPDRLLLLDGRSGRIVRRVALPESARHLALARPGGPVLAPLERSDQLAIVSLPGGELRTTPVGDFPHDAALLGGRIFVGDEGGDTVTVLDARGGRIRTLAAPEQPGSVEPLGDDRVAVVAVAERVVRAIDAHTLEPTGEVTGGVGPTHAAWDGAARLYVADTQGEAVLSYDAEPELAFADRINALGSPYGIAVDGRRNLLWVTLPDRNLLRGFEIPERAGGSRLAFTFETVRQPNAVAVDQASGRVYVAGRADGELQIVEPREEER